MQPLKTYEVNEVKIDIDARKVEIYTKNDKLGSCWFYFVCLFVYTAGNVHFRNSPKGRLFGIRQAGKKPITYKQV